MGNMDRPVDGSLQYAEMPKLNFALEGIEAMLALPAVSKVYIVDKWIAFDFVDGRKNVPQRLRSLAFSPTFNLVVRNTANVIVGGGLKWNKDNPVLDKWFRGLMKMDSETTDVDQLCYKLAMDYLIFNAYSFYCLHDKGSLKQVIQPDGTTTYEPNCKRNVEHIVYLNTEEIRLGRPCNQYGKIDKVYVSKDWDRYLTSSPDRDNTPRLYPFYNSELEFHNSKSHSVYYNRDMKYGANWYPIPNYWGVMADVQNDMAFPIVRKNILENQAIISVVINHPTPKPVVQQGEQMKLFDLQFQGVTNAGKALHTFSSPNTETGQPVKADVQFITHADNVGLYNQTDQHVRRNIINAFGIPPSLVGDVEMNPFSDRDAIKAQWALWEHQTIKPARRFVANAFKEILRNNRANDPQNFLVTNEDIDSVHFEPINLDVILGIADGSIDVNPMATKPV